MKSFDINSLKDWELLLDDLEGNVDKELWLTEVAQKSKKKVVTLLDISDIEREKNVKFQIEFDTQIINLFSSKNELIGYIKPWYYTYGNISKNSHLERKVFDDFVWKWFWQLLYDVYEWLQFPIPKQEYTHKASVILFLMKNGYKLVSRFDLNGEEIEMTQSEIITLEDQLQDYIQNGDLDLENTYKMVL